MNPGPSVWGSANAPVRHGASFSARFPIPGSPCVSDRVCMHECTTWTMVTGRTHAPGVPEFPRFCLHSSLDPSCAFGWREWNPDMPLSWGGSNENESFVKIGSRSNEICLYCAPHVCSLYPAWIPLHPADAFTLFTFSNIPNSSVNSKRRHWPYRNPFCC